MPRSMSSWRRFWNLSIPLQIRTPWYRLLQHKFPCASRMHKLLASSFSSECRFCQIPNVEDEMHFILLCPKKFEVWARVWHHFFGELTLTVNTMEQAIFHLRFPPQKLSAFPNESIVGCAFWCIWRAHWMFIFNGHPFIPSKVFRAIIGCLESFKH
ncbi:hypothetical protein BCV72DRAFT_249629 [Rhizopus microsporus var. microsporus]|uniref:Reverse transcriptase zinc-binding domain-containing protein n=1 Tax=Rhizopus microsporus var. microsporus TaxID=86635 RepID=A0A1X0R4Y0_RHIZD|nr:hypothetical protein BCV72DRAFT_249629 [Rhizopus microsporus var. microsporus]